MFFILLVLISSVFGVQLVSKSMVKFTYCNIACEYPETRNWLTCTNTLNNLFVTFPVKDFMGIDYEERMSRLGNDRGFYDYNFFVRGMNYPLVLNIDPGCFYSGSEEHGKFMNELKKLI